MIGYKPVVTTFSSGISEIVILLLQRNYNVVFNIIRKFANSLLQRIYNVINWGVSVTWYIRCYNGFTKFNIHAKTRVVTCMW